MPVKRKGERWGSWSRLRDVSLDLDSPLRSTSLQCQLGSSASQETQPLNDVWLPVRTKNVLLNENVNKRMERWLGSQGPTWVLDVPRTFCSHVTIRPSAVPDFWLRSWSGSQGSAPLRELPERRVRGIPTEPKVLGAALSWPRLGSHAKPGALAPRQHYSDWRGEHWACSESREPSVRKEELPGGVGEAAH